MQISHIVFTEAAFKDLRSSQNFYTTIATELGDYFKQCLLNDIEALQFFAGIHSKHFDYFRLLAKRFPYAIYYTLEESTVTIVAILDMRKNPITIKHRLK
ncbi:MAG: hypothetical protein OCD01_11835 [Fibrobacterales bacterium]